MRFSTGKCQKMSTRLIQCHVNCDDRTSEIKRSLFCLCAESSALSSEFLVSQASYL